VISDKYDEKDRGVSNKCDESRGKKSEIVKKWVRGISD
jgi:hypothetical protein